MRLATAVGMPICSVGGNLCVIVLFATQPIPMTPNAVEFLCSMARAASGLDNTSGFASSPYSCTPPPSHAKTDQFRGVWDISERLNSTYSTAIDFHLLPIKRLQAFFDFQEVTSLNDLSDTHSAAYPLKVPGQYDFPPFEDFSPNQSSCSIGNGNVGSESDDTQWINANFHHSRVRTVSEVTIAENKDFPKYNCLTADALTMTDISIQRLGGGITAKTSQETNSCGSSEIDEDEEISDASSLEFVFEDDVSRGPSSPTCLPSPKGFRTAIQIDARTSFRTNQSRFHEFMDAILGLTHFDCAELWLLSDRSSELYVVSALHGDEAAHVWTMQSKGMRLKKGMDVPGIVFETGRPHWDKHYDTRHLRRASRKLKKDYSPHSDSTFNPNPRSELASKMGMCTAFGVPLPGPTGGISGVLALYSRVKMEPDPLLLTLVHKSVQLMSSCSATVRTSPLYPETDYYKENSQNNQLSQNNSQNNLNAYHDLPSISENPYSYFCQSDQIKQQQYQQQQQQQQLSHQQHTQHPLSDASSKLAAHSFSSTDFASKDKSFQKVSEDKSFVSDNNLAHNGRNHHQNQNPSLHKRGWTPLNQDQHQQRNYKNQNQHSMSGMTGNLYRTVSANELNSAPHQIPHPHPIYHSHSMPDSMYLESSYANLEIPKSKRARSIDLGSGPGFYNMLGSIPASQGQGQGMLQNIQIPSGVEVYDHMDLHWSSLTKPYDGKNVASSNVAFPFNNSNYHILGADNFPYRGDKASLVKSKQQQYVEFSTESNDTPTVQQKRSQYDMLRYSFQHEMPLLQPVIKVDPNQSSDSATTGKLSAKSKKLSQSQLSLQSLSYDGSSPVDAFNSDLNFTNEFGFIDRDLIFNGYPSSVEEPSSPAAYPPCRVDGCGSDSSHRSPFCVVHAAGGRRCQQEGCNKCAQVCRLILSFLSFSSDKYISPLLFLTYVIVFFLSYHYLFTCLMDDFYVYQSLPVCLLIVLALVCFLC